MMLSQFKKQVLVLSLPLLSFSSGVVSIAAVGVFGASPSAVAETFEWVQYDKSAIEQLLISSTINQNERDRAYFLGTLDGIEREFKTLLSGPVTQLRQLSNRSILQDFVPITDFAGTVSNYKLQRDLLDGKIQKLTLLSSNGFPSQVSFASDNSAKPAPKYEKLDFSNLVSFYSEKLEDIDSQVRNFEYRLTKGDGTPYIISAHSGLGLTVPRSNISSAKLAQLKSDARDLRSWQRSEKAIINAYTIFLRQKIQQFIFTYGKTEKWRWKNKKHTAQMKKEAQFITDAFWTRSYFRATYGMPLGAIGIRYKKSFANLDRLLVSNAALTEPLENPVWSQNDYIEMTNNYQNALNVAQERSGEIVHGDTSFLTHINEFLNMLVGESQYAIASNMMLKLLAADLYEETLITQVGGKAKMISYYKSRYSLTPEDRAYYKNLKKLYEDSTKEPAEDDFYADVGVTGSGGSSLSAHYRAAVDAFSIQEFRLNQARELDKVIATFEGIQDSPYAKRRAKSDL